MTCTLVTAFYPIKSKAPLERYLEWATYFMSLDASIVLFTTPDLEQTFRTMRGHKPIYIITKSFNDLYMWKHYESIWKNHHTMDPENSYHTPELYAIWAQKSSFVYDTWILNPFKTDYFFWCDIGAFRGPLLDSVRRTFPISTYLPDDRILMCSVNRYNGNNHQDNLVGVLWGGSGAGCYRWHLAYCHMLSQYISDGKFAGKDQTVMLSTYLEDTSLAYIVCPGDDLIVDGSQQYNTFDGRYIVNPWFFLQVLLSDTGITYKLDDTYII